MEMIDRYIYAVTQRLPEQQRADIKQELIGLIEDIQPYGILISSHRWNQQGS